MKYQFKDDEYLDVFWAKKKDNHGLFQWMPLKQHLLDVSNIMIQLWNHWLSDKQKRIICESLSRSTQDEALKLVIFLGASHDLAKATPVFQAKKGYNNSEDLDFYLINRLIHHGFDSLDNEIFTSEFKSHHSIAGQAILEKYGIPQSVAAIIGSHHGKPVDDSRTIKQQIDTYPENYYQNEDEESRAYQQWNKVQKDILEWGLDFAGYSSVEDIPQVLMNGQVQLSGLLIVADWIASNEIYFPLQDIDDCSIDFSEGRFGQAWEEWFKTELWIPENNDEAYKERFGFEPRDMQEKFSELAVRVENPGIFIVEAPMGGGKTEAALMVAEQVATRMNLSGVFFGLPTQATSNGMFPRMHEWLNKVVAEDDEAKSLQLVHGKAMLNEEYLDIKSQGRTGESIEETVIVNEWFTGRKTSMLDDFVIGTIDQLLMMSLKGKHLMLRHLGFTKKVVIIDEVHAYDSYMNEYLKNALMWLGSYKIPVIILSATLPGQTREKLMTSYMKGYGVKEKNLIAPSEWTTTDVYPLITYSNGEAVEQLIQFEKQPDKKVRVIRINDEELISLLDEKISDGGVVALVINTVRRAQKFTKILTKHFGEEIVELVHSSFIATDRARKEKHLLKTIGKNGERPHKKIIIGTQVIEQSLDIDFDIMVTDLAPMDLIIQRIGRLHRHERDERPKKIGRPEVYVLGCDENFEFEEGSQAVYGDYLLIRTQMLLPDVVNLPSDISPLVQKTYVDLGWQSELEKDECYQKAKVIHDSLIDNKKRRSKAYMIGEPKKSKRASLVGWLKTSQVNQTEEMSTATVRDSEDSIEIILLKKIENGYCTMTGQKNLKKDFSSSATQMKLARETIRLPGVLSRFYTIEQTIDELEEYRNKILPEWASSSWLKGALGIILNENNECLLNGYRLKYDEKLGLMYQKEE